MATRARRRTKSDNKVTVALREWDAHVKANAALPNPVTTLDPATFFKSRNITYSSWNKLVKSGGTITDLGKARLNPETFTHLTDELFMTWVNMKQPTKAGAAAFAKSHNIRPERWAIFVNAKNGMLTKFGEARVGKLVKPSDDYFTRVTDTHYQDWYQLALRPEYQNTTAAWKFAVDRGLHPSSWVKYVSNDGTFNMAIPTVAARVNRLGLGVPIDLTIPGPSQPPV